MASATGPTSSASLSLVIRPSRWMASRILRSVGSSLMPAIGYPEIVPRQHDGPSFQLSIALISLSMNHDALATRSRNAAPAGIFVAGGPNRAGDTRRTAGKRRKIADAPQDGRGSRPVGADGEPGLRGTDSARPGVGRDRPRHLRADAAQRPAAALSAGTAGRGDRPVDPQAGQRGDASRQAEAGAGLAVGKPAGKFGAVVPAEHGVSETPDGRRRLAEALRAFGRCRRMSASPTARRRA